VEEVAGTMNERQESEQFAALVEAHAASRGDTAAGHRFGDGARGAGSNGADARRGAGPGAEGFHEAAGSGTGALVALAERVAVAGTALPGPSTDFREALRARLVAEAPALVAEGAAAGSGLRRGGRSRVPAQRSGRGSRSGARHSADTKTGGFTGISATWRRRLLAAGVGVAVATGSVGGIAVASAGAEPGDPLYSAKKIFESLQLSLSGSPTDQGRDYLHLADIRLGEIDSLLNRPDVDMAGSPTQAYLNQTLGELRTMITEGGNLLIVQVQQHGDQTALHALADFLLTERQRVADLSWRLPPDLQSQPPQIVTLMDQFSRELQVAAQRAAEKQTQSKPSAGQQGGTGQQGQNGGGASGAATTSPTGPNPTPTGTAETSSPASATTGGASSGSASGSASSSSKPSSGSSASSTPSAGTTIGINLPVPILPSIGVTIPSLLGLPEIDINIGGDGESSPSASASPPN
jgi:Domain of unknown function (DUF5667)